MELSPAFPLISPSAVAKSNDAGRVRTGENPTSETAMPGKIGDEALGCANITTRIVSKGAGSVRIQPIDTKIRLQLMQTQVSACPQSSAECMWAFRGTCPFVLSIQKISGTVECTCEAALCHVRAGLFGVGSRGVAKVTPFDLLEGALKAVWIILREYD